MATTNFSPTRGDFIAGRFVHPSDPDGELVSVCPGDLTHELARFAYAISHVDDAVAAARAAQRAWHARGQEERASFLRRYQERLRVHRDTIAHHIALEIGKPLWEARTEVDAMIGKVDLVLGPGSEFTRDQDVPELPGEIRYLPLGVVAVLGPFNFPGHLPNGHFLPALLLGNTVVFKPSENALGTGQAIARCFAEADLPEGVFNVVAGEAESGKLLCRHGDVDGILFTGSAAVGRAIVADNLHRLDRLIALELGGKNPALVFDDCDLERTARAIAFSAFATCGQRCTATSRVITTAGVADALCQRLAELGRGLSVGHPLSDATFMGPLISDAAAHKLARGRQVALDAGAVELVADSALSVRERGHYVRPTVHKLPRSVARVTGYTDEELFGPDLAVQVVTGEDQAFDLANDGKYGLSASVFTADRERFERAASTLRVGVLHWNRPGAGASGRLPFSGLKGSGNHRPAGILTGLTCSYPLSVLLPKPGQETEPLPTWPGFV